MTRKNLIIIALFSMLSQGHATAQTKPSRVTINGIVPADVKGKVYLQKFNNKIFDTLDSVEIKDCKFAFSKNLELPELYGLTTDKEITPYYIFLEKGVINVSLNPENHYRESVASGSTLQDEFVEYKKNQLTDINKYIQQHPKSLVSAYILYRDFAYRLSAEQINQNIERLDASLQQTKYVENLKEYVKTLGTTGIGAQAPDFSAPTPDGSVIALKDVIKGNKYVLIDFWASWCGPCRKENPNVVNAYTKYHDKGFEVLGVSLDRNKDSWIKAIADDNLTWQHVSDLKFWASVPAKFYGVRVIPSNFLVDSTGKIVAHNLRGDALLNFLESLNL